MSKIISLQEVRSARLMPGSDWPCETASGEAGWPLPSKDDVHRAILLLDLAAQHARLLVKKIADESRRENFEAQIATIEQLLQVARQLVASL